MELEFLALMCQESKNALEAGDWQRFYGSLRELKELLENHLINWIPEFCTRIERCSSTDFYVGIAKITKGFLCLEKRLLEGLVSETVAQ